MSYEFGLVTLTGGDDWRHAILLEKIFPLQKGMQLPACTGGRRACPPEDCGGIRGYYHVLEALADPHHGEYSEMVEWVGGRFDPDAFDASAVVFDDPEAEAGSGQGGVEFVEICAKGSDDPAAVGRGLRGEGDAVPGVCNLEGSGRAQGGGDRLPALVLRPGVLRRDHAEQHGLDSASGDMKRCLASHCEIARNLKNFRSDHNYSMAPPAPFGHHSHTLGGFRMEWMTPPTSRVPLGDRHLLHWRSRLRRDQAVVV